MNIHILSLSSLVLTFCSINSAQPPVGDNELTNFELKLKAIYQSELDIDLTTIGHTQKHPKTMAFIDENYELLVNLKRTYEQLDRTNFFASGAYEAIVFLRFYQQLQEEFIPYLDTQPKSKQYPDFSNFKNELTQLYNSNLPAALTLVRTKPKHFYALCREIREREPLLHADVNFSEEELLRIQQHQAAILREKKMVKILKNQLNQPE